MIKNTLSSLLIITIFLVGLFFVLPNNAFSQGCCQDTVANLCIPNANASECTDPGDIWFANDPVCPGGDIVCEGYVGCCICNRVEGDCFDGDTCVGDLTQEACSNSVPFGESDWVFGSCDDITACDTPTGCCQTAPSCSITTEDGCDVGTWTENTECLVSKVCGSNAPGCCSTDEDGVTCKIIPDGEDCEDNVDTFGEGEICNTENTCGQLGCCQVKGLSDEDPSCAPTNVADCVGLGDDGTWAPAPDSCTDSGLCARNLLGCCVFYKNDCEDISALSCEVSDGEFELASCSEVPICNVVVSPIPTLNQWGLIAMAGLLGLFSLFIIIRRHRYNLS